MPEIFSQINNKFPSNSIKTAASTLDGRQKDEAGELKTAAVQFEAIFLKMFLD